MNLRSTTQTKTSSSFSPIQTGLLQRKCNSCGQHTIAGGDCTDCQPKSGLQRKLTIGTSNDPLELEADRVADRVLAAPTMRDSP
jgi:tRNA(Ile2) C34 agmatinyltransferase TiaS